MALSRAHARTAQALTALLLFCSAGHAQEIIVPTQMPLSVALASAAPGTTITLLPSGSPYQTFPGYSFSGKHLTIRGSTGNPADVVIDGVGLDRVLTISNTASSGMTHLQNLTLANGRGPTALGGGLHLDTVSIIIDNCIIRDNLVVANNGNGAGIYATGPAPTGSTLIVRNTTFENNAIDGTAGVGAALFVVRGSATFEDCRFLDNKAMINLAAGTASVGGAVYVARGPSRFIRCTFTGNQAQLGGAAYVGIEANGTFEACLFDENTANHGGALYTSPIASSTVIRNSVIVRNHAVVRESALRCDNPTTVINCTIADNTAGDNLVFSSAASDRRTLTIDNSIIWNNTAQAMTVGSGTNFPIIRRSIVQATYAPANGSGHNVVIDPLFGSPAAGDFRLQPGSPAIDAGDTGLYFGPLADYDGNIRGVAASSSPTGTSLNGPIIDMGAFEFFVEPCYANCDGSTTPPILNIDDFTCFINRFAQGCP